MKAMANARSHGLDIWINDDIGDEGKAVVVLTLAPQSGRGNFIEGPWLDPVLFMSLGRNCLVNRDSSSNRVELTRPSNDPLSLPFLNPAIELETLVNSYPHNR